MRFILPPALLLLAAAPVIAEVVEPPAKALSYLKRLEQRPQPGSIFERFCDSFLTERTAAELGAFLESKPEYGLLLALWQRHEFKFDAAQKTLTQLLKERPQDAVALEQLTEIQMALKDTAGAVVSAERLAKLPDLDEPSRERAGQLLAKCLWKAGRADESLAQWQSLLAAKPGDMDLQDACADALERDGRWAQLVKLLTAWLPETKDAFRAMERRLRLARVLMADGQKDPALEVLKTALSQSAADSWMETEALAQIEVIYRRDDQVTTLSETLEKERLASPGRVLLAMRSASILGELGKLEPAQVIHRDLLAKVPGNRDLREQVAGQLTSWKLWPAAAAQWEHLVATYPQDALLHLHLAEMKARSGQEQPALTEARAYVRLQKNSDSAWLQAAQMLGGAGMQAQGITLLTEAATALPDSIAILRAHADALAAVKRNDEARPLWIRLAGVGEEDDVVLAAERLRIEGEEGAKRAWSVMLQREKDFARSRRFLQTLCEVALLAGHGDEVLPRALTFVRLGETAGDVALSCDWAVKFMRAADHLEPALKDWKKVIGNQAGEPVRDLVLHALAEDAAGQSARANVLLKPAWEKVTAETGARLSDESSLIAQTWLRLLSRRGDVGKAAEASEVILSHSAEQTGTLFQTTTKLWEQAFQTEKALAVAERWRVFADGNPAAWVANARLLSLLGKAFEAQDLLRKAALRMDADPGALGIIAQAQGDFGDAKEGIKLALRLYDREENDASRLRHASTAAKAARQAGTAAYASVVERFSAAQEREKARAMPALALAAVLQVDKASAGNRASTMLEMAVRAEPKNTLALSLHAQQQQMDGNWKGAAESWRKLLELSPDPGIQKSLGQALIKAGELEEGTRLTLAAAQPLIQVKGPAASGDPEMDLAIADMLVAAGQPAQAAELLAHADDFRARYLHAVALVQDDQVQPAIEALLGVLALTPTQPDKTENFWDRHAPASVAWRQRLASVWAKAQRDRQAFDLVVTHYVPENVPQPDDIREARGMALVHLAVLAGYLTAPEREKLKQRALLVDSSIPAQVFSTASIKNFAPDDLPSKAFAAAYYYASWPGALEQASQDFRPGYPAFALLAELAGLRPLEGEALLNGGRAALQHYRELAPAQQQENELVGEMCAVMTRLAGMGEAKLREAGSAQALEWATEMETSAQAMVKARSPRAAAVVQTAVMNLAAMNQWDRSLKLLDAVLPDLRQDWAMQPVWREDTMWPYDPGQTPFPHLPFKPGDLFNTMGWGTGPNAMIRPPTSEQIKQARDPMLRALLHWLVQDLAACDAQVDALLAAEPQNLDALWLRALSAIKQKKGERVDEAVLSLLRAPWPAEAERQRDELVLLACVLKKDTLGGLRDELRSAIKHLGDGGLSVMALQRWQGVLHGVDPELVSTLASAAKKPETASPAALPALPPLPSLSSASSANQLNPNRTKEPAVVGSMAGYLLALAPRVLRMSQDSDVVNALSDLARAYGSNAAHADLPMVCRHLESMRVSGQAAPAHVGMALLLAKDVRAGRAVLEQELAGHLTNPGIRHAVMLAQACEDPVRAARTFLDTPESDRNTVLSQSLNNDRLVEFLKGHGGLKVLNFAQAVVKDAAAQGMPLGATTWLDDLFYSEIWDLTPGVSPQRGYQLWCAPYRVDISPEERAGMAEMLRNHDQFCGAALGVPDLAYSAFSLLACSRMGQESFNADELAAQAELTLETMRKGVGRIADLRTFDVSDYMCRWEPSPPAYLVWHAWTQGRLKQDLPGIMERARNAKVPDEYLTHVSAQAELLACPPADFVQLARKWKTKLVEQGAAISLFIKLWAQRGFDVDVTPLVETELAELRKLRGSGTRLYFYSYAEWLALYVRSLEQHGRHKEAESFLTVGCETLMGPRDQWVKPDGPPPEKNAGTQDAESFLSACTVVCPRLLMPALKLRFSFGRDADQYAQGQEMYLVSWLPAFCQREGESLRPRTTPAQRAALLDDLSFVADDPPRPFRFPVSIHTGSGDRPPTLLEAMATSVFDPASRNRQVTDWLQDHPKARKHPGPDIFAAVARGQGQELMEAVVRWQDALIKMPPDVLMEWVDLIDRQMRKARAAEDALASRAPRLYEQVKKCRLESQRQRIDKVLAAREFTDIGSIYGSSQFTNFEQEIGTMSGALLSADFARGQALLAAGLHLMDKEWVKQRWYGSSGSNGWTGPSEMLQNWMQGTKELRVLAAALNILGAKEEKSLVHAFWPTVPSTGGVLALAWRNAGALADPEAAFRAVIADLDQVLAPGPAPLLWLSFSDWAERMEPWQRYQLESLAPAVSKEPGRAGECGRMLDIALRFRKLQKKQSSGAEKEADLALVRGWFQQLAADESINAMVRFGLQHYYIKILAKEVGRDEVLRVARVAVAAMNLNQPNHGYTYQSAAVAMLTLPADDEWKKVARELVDTWMQRIRYERAGTNRPFYPADDLVPTFFELGCRCFEENDIARLMTMIQGEPRAPVLLALLRGGHVKLARNYFMANEMNIQTDIQNAKFELRDEPALKEMLEGITDPERRLHAEVLVCGLTGYGTGRAHIKGWNLRQWDQRMAGIADRFVSQDWRNEKVELAVRQALFESPRASAKMFPELGTNDMRELVIKGRTGNLEADRQQYYSARMWDAFAFGDGLTDVRKAVVANNVVFEQHPWEYAATAAERVLLYASGMEPDDLRKTCGITRGLLAGFGPSSKDNIQIAALMAVHLCATAAADDGVAELAWRDKLRSASTREALRALVAKKQDLWPSLQAFLKTKDDKPRPLAERAAIVARLLADPWLLEVNRDNRTLVAQIVENNILTADELRAHAESIINACPANGSTASAMALLFLNAGDQGKATALMKRALDEARTGRRLPLVVELTLRLSEMLKSSGGSDEAVELVKALPKESSDPAVASALKRLDR